MGARTLRLQEFKGVRIEVETTDDFAAVVAKLREVTGHTTVAAIVELAKSTRDPDLFAKEVERQFVGESGFMLFSENDHGGWIRLYGLPGRVTRWVLGNPLIAITMMRRDITAGLFAPVEMLMAETETGGTKITYVRPSSLIAIGDDEELLHAAQKLDAKLEALAADIAGAS
jgi:hypothetical protein